MIRQFVDNVGVYMSSVVTGVKPFLATILAGISYAMFPHSAFKNAILAVCIAVILDIITKWIAISIKSGGYFNAVRTKKLWSKKLWKGTYVKLFSYLVIFILVGLSYRVTPIEQVSIYFATTVYLLIFLRESQSCIENLIESGADLKWLLIFVNTKREQVMNEALSDINHKEE